MKLNKKGSHISIVISFIIFVIFILFIYALMVTSVFHEETIKTELKKSIFKMKDLMQGEVIVVRFDGDGSDVSFSDSDFSNMNFVAIDAERNSLNTGRDAETVFVEGFIGLTKIYFHDSFGEHLDLLSSGSDPITPTITNETHYLEKVITNLINDGDYEETKQNLGLNKGTTYEIVFIDKDGESTDELEKPQTNIYSETIQIRYLDENGIQEKGELRINVW